MGNQIPVSGQRIKHLMDSHDPKIGSALQLSRKMYEAGIFPDSETSHLKYSDLENYISNKSKSIGNHLNDSSVMDSRWLKSYCDFFHCSADYLLGYISSPTHAATDIAKETGLWEENIKALDKQGVLFLNALISSEKFSNMSDDFRALLSDSTKLSYTFGKLSYFDGREDGLNYAFDGHKYDKIECMEEITRKIEQERDEIKQEKSSYMFKSVFYQLIVVKQINQLSSDFADFLDFFDNTGNFKRVNAKLFDDLNATMNFDD